MNQTEFNKQERYEKLINEAVSKNLNHTFVLNEFKRNRWNLNEKQVVEVANKLGVNADTILNMALDLNILNVSNKLKKAILKGRKENV
jgi:hypothetical protein